MVDPVLKWAGGKRQLLDKLYRYFPTRFKRYHEPMVGGGALFFDLEPSSGSVNDTNPRLVNLYRQIRNNPEPLVETLENYRSPESPPDKDREFNSTTRDGDNIENYYYQQRELFNRRPNDESFDEVEEAALLVYLNRTCYNGLYRENQDGEFNVPRGRYDTLDRIRRREIREASVVLEGVEILNRDMEYIEEYASEDDLVYFDPPYEPLSSSEDFTSYSSEGFGRKDQRRLIEVAGKLDNDGVYVILSNSGVMYTVYQESGFDVGKVGAKRAINSDGEGRGEVEEVIATNISSSDRGGWGQTVLDRY